MSTAQRALLSEHRENRRFPLTYLQQQVIMSVSSPTSSTLTTNVAVTGTARETTGDQYVRIRVGESELAIGTETLAGVFQVSNQNRLTGNGTVLTACLLYTSPSPRD